MIDHHVIRFGVGILSLFNHYLWGECFSNWVTLKGGPQGANLWMPKQAFGSWNVASLQGREPEHAEGLAVSTRDGRICFHAQFELQKRISWKGLNLLLLWSCPWRCGGLEWTWSELACVGVFEKAGLFELIGQTIVQLLEGCWKVLQLGTPLFNWRISMVKWIMTVIPG